MINTFIFDMDGLLVDSEPLWKLAEKKVFGALGLNLTDDLLRQVMGFRLPEVVAHWYRFQPWPDPNFLQVEQDIIAEMKLLIDRHAVAMQGVQSLLKALQTKGFKIALASSSAMELIEQVVRKLDIKPYFDVICSAETEPYGKPHPGIFIHTAEKLQSSPMECLVFEDSLNGMIAAKAARMTCVVVPEPEKFSMPHWALADQCIHSLEQFDLHSFILSHQ